jgi:hypothetical protein
MTSALILLAILLIIGGPTLTALGFAAPVDLHPSRESLPIYAFYTGIALYTLGIVLLIFAAWIARP